MVCDMAESAVPMGRRPGSILGYSVSPHRRKVGVGHDSAAANLWAEAKRIWLAGASQSGR
jgi:hypothetical protein